MATVISDCNRCLNWLRGLCDEYSDDCDQYEVEVND